MSSREILFRGKRKDNGEWVYGYPLIDNADCSLKAKGQCKCKHDGSIGYIFFWNDEDHEYQSCEVDTSTVKPYTGFTDKNGKKIFEGDILVGHLDTGYPENETVVKVIWYRNGWYTQQKNCIPDLLEESDGKYFGIIGNIHDNPELLEAQE